MFLVFGKDECSYCSQTKKVLDQLGLDYLYFDLTDEIYIRNAFKTLGHDTMPYIVRDGEKIGGFDDLQKILMKEMM